VSHRREALIARYRAISLERLRVIRARLDGVAAGNAEALADVRRELHTLKGDSHLLGLVRIGELAHACEGRLQDPDLEGAARAVGAALEAVKAALRDEVTDQAEIDEQLRQALAALTGPERDEPARAPAARDRTASSTSPPPARGEPASAPSANAPTASAPRETAAPEPALRAESSRWMYVNAHDVDVVCERLSALHADLGRIHATLRGMLSHARDTMHDVERLRADLDEIVSSAWALRLSPVHPALAELGEHALELARDQRKELRIRIDDGGALVERRLLDEVREPLLHLVRNAVDHGIEPAHERGDKPVPAEIVLSAEGRADHVVITVADDGRGISVPTVRAIAVARGLLDPTTVLTEEGARELLFLHGFSTRQGATRLSGRGVGLDAVRRRLTAIGGWVSVASNPGGGTRFAIHIPSTVFRERVLIADVGGALCALPAREVEAVVPIGPGGASGGSVEAVGSTPLLRYDGEGIPFLQLPLFRGGAESTRAAIVTHSGRRWAIALPDVVGDVEMLRAPVDAAVAALGPFAASGTLDDGRLVLVVSLDALLSRPRQITEFSRAPVRERRRRVLVVDDSPIVRDLLGELLSSVGLEVRTAGDGAAALEALDAEAFDLIVCDVEMPVMDGFELLRRLRARSDRVPVVMVTTRGSAADRSLAAALGADALIVKSEFENAHLLAAVRRFVEIGA
jgi:two-component system chemotaxis sensor kinase CheA/two-component system sensor histidine kinase and response regulator WspE